MEKQVITQLESIGFTPIYQDYFTSWSMVAGDHELLLNFVDDESMELVLIHDLDILLLQTKSLHDLWQFITILKRS